MGELDEFMQHRALDERLAREREDEERKRLVAELRRLTAREHAIQRLERTLAEHAPTLAVPALAAPLMLPEAPRHTWVLLLSDWHVGQRTTLAESGHLFEQTTEATWEQVRRLWETLELLLGLAARATAVEELVILVLGDLVEGDGMRPSQAAAVDRLVTQQAVETADMLSWLFQQALGRVARLRARVTGGNHDRTSQKPGNAGLGELGYVDTYAWLIGAFLSRLFDAAQAAGRLDLVNHESFWGSDVVAGQRLVYEHGASFKTSTGSYGGIGWYSIVNAARGYMEMLEGADMVLMGHFLTPALLPMGARGWQVLNGSLPPSTPFVQSRYKRVTRPTQVLLDLHPDVGLVSWRPIYLDHGPQGAYWERVHDLARAA